MGLARYIGPAGYIDVIGVLTANGATGLVATCCLSTECGPQGHFNSG